MTPDTDPIARYERFRQADPDNPNLIQALGDLYHRAGRFDQALACFADGLRVEPGNAALRGRLAMVWISQHRFAEAEQQLQELVADSPGDPALWHNLGLAQFHQKKFDAARDSLATAEGKGARAPETYSHLAHAWHHLGDVQRAREAAQRWAQVSPSAAAEGYLSLVELDCGDYDAAFARADATLAKDPDNVDANVVSGVNALEQQQIERAESQYATASRLEPDNPRAWVGVALVRLHHREHARAIEAFERALALSPRNVGTIIALGWAQLSIREHVAAEKTFRRAILVDRTFGEAYGGLASALVMQNRRDEARREIERARRLNAGGFGAVYAQSVLLALEGRQPLGERLMTKALQRSVRPGTPSLYEYSRTFLRQLPAPTGPEAGPGPAATGPATGPASGPATTGPDPEPVDSGPPPSA